MNTQSLAKHFTTVPLKALCAASLIAFMGVSAQAQSTATTGKATMPMGDMHKGATGAHDMKGSMMMGMDEMQKMTMSGDTDKDFAMMMKIHHQQALNMAEMQLKTGKSPEMKSMAKKIIVAQKKEIAQFDKWLAKQK
ncbi:MAG: DUF305 domain-containing protein [Pseudomonadota bacterium]